MSVDVSVENRGGRSALITSMEARCSRNLVFWSISEPVVSEAAIYGILESRLLSSSTTEVELPIPTGKPFTVKAKMSQLIESGEFDRFQILVSVPIPRYCSSCLYVIRLEFKHDMGKGSLDSDWLLLCSPSAPKLAETPSVRNNLQQFIEAVKTLRAEVDDMREAVGLPALDWFGLETNPALQGEVVAAIRAAHDDLRILDNFLRPAAAVEQYFQTRIAQLEALEKVVDGVGRVEMIDSGTAPNLAQIGGTLTELKNLRTELRDQIEELSARSAS